MTRTTRASLAVALAGAVLPLLACGGGPEEEAAPVDTVFVGDSVTRGVSAETFAADDDFSWVTYAVADERSPWRLEAKVAVFGRTLIEMEAAFAPEVLARDPDGVVIMGGTNDALRQLPVEPSMEALRSMVVAARDAGAEVWVVSPAPLDGSYARPIAPFVAAEQALAAELDVAFVDVSTPLTDTDGRWLPGLSFDGVHPAEEGARRIADLVLDEFGASGG